jgi:hypothetical protein
MEKRVEKVKDVNGNEMVILIVKPNSKQLRDAQLVQNQAFKQALNSGALLRARLDDHMKEQGLWNDAKEAELKSLTHKISEGERKLAKGGAGGFTKAQARQLAIDMSKWRNDQSKLLMSKRQLDEYTVEGQAENARFDYLVSICTEKEDTSPYFSSLEDYRERADEEASVKAATTLATLLFSFDNDWQSNLPENKFLKQHKFVDDKFRLINKEGKLIDEDGRLVNEDGRFINDKGEFINKDGERVDLDGNAVENFVPFEEDVVVSNVETA